MARASIRLILFLLMAPVAAAPQRASADDEVSCECGAFSCGVCELETGVTFYAEKCGPALARMKSCKKPTCEAVGEQKQCLAALGISGGGREPASTFSKTGAAAPAARAVARAVARIVALQGGATVIRVGGGGEAARLAMDLRVGDAVETVDGARLKIVFDDGNEIVVGPRSKLAVEAHRFDGKDAARRTVLLLHQGGMRSSVKVAYDGKEKDGAMNEYVVRTRAAVAGVRGTDFLTFFDPNGRDWKMNVRTFEGQVRLSGLDEAAGDETRTDARADVGPGHEATFTAEKAGAPGASVAEQNAAIARGRITQPFAMKADEMRSLAVEWTMRSEISSGAIAGDEAVKVARAPAAAGPSAISSSDSSVCSSPRADFNECSWSCEGPNPKGSARCRTDLPEVKCVRRICRANGAWSDATRMPASQGDSCDGGTAIVRPCDY